MSALNNQVSGDHYTTMKLQPMELAYILGATPAFTKVAKYTTRKKDDMLQQVDKALHCVEFEQQFYVQRGFYVKLDMNFVVDKIEEFTDNTHLQNTLIFMYTGKYEAATECLNKFKKSLNK